MTPEGHLSRPDTSHHLAHVNVARMRAPLSDDLMADFVARIDEIEALAEAAPGFIWRLTAPGSSLPELQAYGKTFLFTLTLWQDVASLKNYVYRSAHVELLRARRQWFGPGAESAYALWWLPAGKTPTVKDALERLEHLRQHGATPSAFTFTSPFAPPMPHVAEAG